MSSTRGQATIAGCLRVADGFTQDEWPGIVDRLAALDDNLASYPADGTQLDLSVRDRERPGQKMTLECWIAGRTRLVATSTSPSGDVGSALVEVRTELRRQLEDAKSRIEDRRHG
ncbi:hypothetical protein [Kineosporia sp. A_224]|uniref:hypothetical protein n=1 Tax=Kineosporia sp. A_224 TaxID=1962180 RepID=UPI000B4C02BE|nr:hypothetical protein [Kineosporia sp. A_224]